MAGLTRFQIGAIIMITTITIVFLIIQNNQNSAKLVDAEIVKDLPSATSFQGGDRVAISRDAKEKKAGSGRIAVVMGGSGQGKKPDAHAEAPPIEITASNLAGFVSRCFKGEPCQLADDPAKMYANYKIAGNSKAIDQLISLMRLKLKDPEFKKQNQDQLKKMIDEFYPDNERQFQDAAFYDYAGDYKKSADLYLDLEKEAAIDPSLKPAPSLNIANVLYEGRRFSEALPYYEKAEGEYSNGTVESAEPGNREMLDFIDGRIAEIRSKASN